MSDTEIRKASTAFTLLHLLYILVGATGFEPATTWSQTRCATGLRYAPKPKNIDLFNNFQLFEDGNHNIKGTVYLLFSVGSHQRETNKRVLR